MNAHVLRNSGDTSSEGSTVPVLVYDYRIKRWTFIEKIDVEVKGYSGYFSGGFQLFFRVHSFYDFDGAPHLFIKRHSHICIYIKFFLCKIYKEELFLLFLLFLFIILILIFLIFLWL